MLQKLGWGHFSTVCDDLPIDFDVTIRIMTIGCDASRFGQCWITKVQARKNWHLRWHFMCPVSFGKLLFFACAVSTGITGMSYRWAQGNRFNQ